MTFLGWAQIALYCLIIVGLTRPLGGYMTRLFAGERTLPVAGTRARRAWLLPSRRRRRANRAALGDLRAGHARLQCPGLPPALRAATAAGRPAAEPARYGGDQPAPLVQHRGQLRHQHQLAVLRRREHAGLPGPDGRAHGAELRLGRHRHRSGGGLRAWLHARQRLHHRQLLGRSGPLHPLSASAALHHPVAVLRLAGRAAESRPLRRRDDRSRAASRRSRKVRSPRSSRSRCWAPMAAASSTPTRRIPTRTRRHSAISCRSSRSSRSVRA